MIEPREFGRAQGSALADKSKSLALVSSSARLQAENHVRVVRSRADALHEELGNARKLADQARARTSDVGGIADEWERRRMDSPEEFGLARGLAFLAVGGLTILSDVVILGGVFASLLGTDQRTAGGKRFSQALFSDWSGLFSSFADILVLSISVLLLGIMLKIWIDPPKFGSSSTRWGKLVAVSLGLALVTLSVIALARFFVLPPGAKVTPGTEEFLVRFSSMTLGIALPIVGACFTIAGLRLLSNRLAYSRQAKLRRSVEADVRSRDAEVSSLVEQLRGAADDVAQCGDSFINAKVAEAEAAFLDGYREAVTALLQPSHGQSVFERVRQIALREAIEN